MSYYIILYHIIIFINAHPSVFSPGVATTGSWWILWDVLEPDSPASPRMSGKLWMWEISGWTNWKCPEISGVLEFQTIFFSEKYYREPVLPNWLTLSGLDEKLGFWDSCNVFYIVVFHIECFVKLSEQDSELQNQRYMLGISSLSASHVFDRKTKTRCRKNNAEFPVSLSQQIPVCRIVQNFFSPQLPRRPCTAITSGSIGTSLTSFASAAWDELRFQKARKCGPNSHRCFAVPGHYKWHRVNSGSFHRWRCHRPGHPVESQFLTNH